MQITLHYNSFNQFKAEKQQYNKKRKKTAL